MFLFYFLISIGYPFLFLTRLKTDVKRAVFKRVIKLSVTFRCLIWFDLLLVIISVFKDMSCGLCII